ncbi:UNVERIFIED_CONTAM: hypothetical protein FKN15_036519 [Acipenser sinensis]
MAPEVAAVEKKGGYNQLCDIWAVGITAIELAELQPPMFDLHPMRALMLMSKSNFQPPKLKDKGKWSTEFQNFIKLALNKNPRKRPTAEKLLQHSFMTQMLSRTQVIELLDTVNNPDLSSGHSMDDSDLETCDAFPDKIHSIGKHGNVERTRSEVQFNQVKFCPPMRKETDPYPELEPYDDWSIDGGEKNSPSLLECVEEALMERSLTIKKAPSTEAGSSTFKRSAAATPSPVSTQPSLLDIASSDQMSRANANSQDVKGKSSQLYSHNLTALFDQKRHLLKRQSQLSLSTNRLTERIIPRKYAVSTKISDTKGCLRCSVVRNPYTDSTFLCGALPSSLALLLWYEPLQKFMLLKHFVVPLPDPLPVFELLVQGSDELPQVCVGVREPVRANQELEFDIIHLNDTASPKTDSLPLNVVQVSQLDRDTVLIALQKLGVQGGYSPLPAVSVSELGVQGGYSPLPAVSVSELGVQGGYSPLPAVSVSELGVQGGYSPLPAVSVSELGVQGGYSPLPAVSVSELGVQGGYSPLPAVSVSELGVQGGYSPLPAVSVSELGVQGGCNPLPVVSVSELGVQGGYSPLPAVSVSELGVQGGYSPLPAVSVSELGVQGGYSPLPAVSVSELGVQGGYSPLPAVSVSELGVQDGYNPLPAVSVSELGVQGGCSPLPAVSVSELGVQGGCSPLPAVSVSELGVQGGCSPLPAVSVSELGVQDWYSPLPAVSVSELGVQGGYSPLPAVSVSELGVQGGYNPLPAVSVSELGVQGGYSPLPAVSVSELGVQGGYSPLPAVSVSELGVQGGYSPLPAVSVSELGVQGGYSPLPAVSVSELGVQGGYSPLPAVSVSELGVQGGYSPLPAVSVSELGVQGGYSPLPAVSVSERVTTEQLFWR